ncbi:hypothetical protein CEXT_79881 [Caerostris extrusa]|uniref:Uncharacterized protein n=1 Tax=Caerostris extrusa TaxID=172846 RepID=A0AAV4THQ5_CAEEX|nr:hypothetical protein CEXT_79881 [Caerostris extrusa]
MRIVDDNVFSYLNTINAIEEAIVEFFSEQKWLLIPRDLVFIFRAFEQSMLLLQRVCALIDTISVFAAPSTLDPLIPLAPLSLGSLGSGAAFAYEEGACAKKRALLIPYSWAVGGAITSTCCSSLEFYCSSRIITARRGVSFQNREVFYSDRLISRIGPFYLTGYKHNARFHGSYTCYNKLLTSFGGRNRSHFWGEGLKNDSKPHSNLFSPLIPRCHYLISSPPPQPLKLHAFKSRQEANYVPDIRYAIPGHQTKRLRKPSPCSLERETLFFELSQPTRSNLSMAPASTRQHQPCQQWQNLEVLKSIVCRVEEV